MKLMWQKLESFGCPSIIQYQNVIDGQTDGETDISAVAVPLPA